MNRRPADRRGPSFFSQAVCSDRHRSRMVWALRVLFVVLLIGGTTLRWHNVSAGEVPAPDRANLPLVTSGGLSQTTTVNPQTSGTITVDDSVRGNGPNQFNYVGAWGHCLQCSDGAQIGMYDLSNSWDATANDYLTVTFTGTGIRLYGVRRNRTGIGAVSIDGGAETLVDTYSATDRGNQLLWSSPSLPASTHTLKLRVTGTKNPSSTGFYVTPDRVDILTSVSTPTATRTSTPMPPTATPTNTPLPPTASRTRTPVPPTSTPTRTPTPALPAYVQVASAVPQSSVATVSVTYAGAQHGGDTNIVAIGWNDTSASISAVRDSAGNTYQVATPLSRGTGLSQAIYYAKNIVAAPAGGNTITITFNQPAITPDVRALEYSGLDQSSPFDASASAAGSSNLADSGAATTHAANEVLFGAGMTFGAYTGAGSGYTTRIVTSPDADIAEDQPVSATSSYHATAPVNSYWLMQLATFKAAGSVSPTATRTNTPLPPTATRTNTPVQPTAVRTSTPTGTGTPIPATATATGTPPSGTQWTNVTSNLANMPSQCGNLTLLSAVPNSDTVIAGVALDGLWASNNGGASWSHLGTGSGSDTIINRPSWITYDPTNPATFWESGIYNSNGAYQTADGGNTFHHLGSVTHDDFISVDFSDPQRKTLLVGGHEQSQSVWKSTDGGQTWTNIGLNLPAGTGFSSDPLLINAQTYVVNTDTSWGGGSPGIYRTTDGGNTWTKVSSFGPNGIPLVTSNGTIYWPYGGSLLKSTDAGVTWTQVGGGLQSQIQWIHPIELPDGRLVSVGSSNLVISVDGGVTWNAIGPPLPYVPAGVIYSPALKAFFIWTWDCGSAVLPNAIEKLDYDFGFTTSAPTPTSSNNAN